MTMNFSTAFHEICHLWVLVFHLKFESGRAHVKDIGNGYEMATVSGFTTSSESLSDLEDTAQYMVAGIAGECLIDLIEEDQDLFELFTNDESYVQDNAHFQNSYSIAVSHYGLDEDIERWFYQAFNSVTEFLESWDLDKLKEAADYFLEHEDYELVSNHQP